MWVPLIFVILLLAVVFFQSTQGLFGAMIMMVLTLCCAAFAFGSYEWAASEHMAKYWKPDMAHAISLAALFGVPLVILRLILDKLVRRSCLLPSMIDKVGGGMCGLVTGLAMVGVAGTVFQMVPFGNSTLGFSRFDLAIRDTDAGGAATPPDVDAAGRGLWLGPDRFATGVAAMMSDGVFSGKRSFYQEHPAFLEEAAWVNTINPAVSRFAPSGSLRVTSTEPVEVVYRLIPGDAKKDLPAQFEPISPRSSYEFRMVGVKLTPAAFDQNKSHLFSLRQFRVVGEDGGALRQFFPVATQHADPAEAVNRHISFKRYGGKDWPIVDELIGPRSDHPGEVELVFELPTRFEPHFIEYKRNARATVSFRDSVPTGGTGAPDVPDPGDSRTSASDTKGTPVAATDAPTGSERDSRRSRRRGGADTDAPRTGSGGRVRGFATIPGSSVFGDKLPFEVKSYRDLNNTEVSHGKLVSGHLSADAADQADGDAAGVTTLQVPADKRLLHLNVGRLTARSGLGRALSKAVSVAQNYLVTDENGATYKLVGKYALADVNGTQRFELQYFPEQVGTVGGVGAFQRIKEDDLKRGDELVFLFLVDPGVKLVSFTTGGAATRAEDLRAENLVAPQ